MRMDSGSSRCSIVRHETKWLAAFEPVDRESVSVVNANVQIELLGQCGERSFFDREGVAARSKAEEVRRPGRHRHRPECAHQCAQTRSEDHHSAANANQEGNKTGLKLSISGPFRDFWQP